jgi:hypothetical protein
MELLGDMGLVECHFFSVERQCLHGCKIRARFALNLPIGPNWMHLMVLLGDEAQVEARFGPFVDSVSVGARKEHRLR